jgi:hypothetical protein
MTFIISYFVGQRIGQGMHAFKVSLIPYRP